MDFLPFQSSVISESLGAMLEEDGDLCPGINCCMVCGAPSKLSCPSCNAVSYCSEKVRIFDGQKNIDIAISTRRQQLTQTRSA